MVEACSREESSPAPVKWVTASKNHPGLVSLVGLLKGWPVLLLRLGASILDNDIACPIIFSSKGLGTRKKIRYQLLTFLLVHCYVLAKPRLSVMYPTVIAFSVLYVDARPLPLSNFSCGSKTPPTHLRLSPPPHPPQQTRLGSTSTSPTSVPTNPTNGPKAN
jgi:hypothetical protein